MLSAVLGIATIVAMNGCSSLCGAREQRAVTLGAGIDGLTVVRDGTTRRIEVVTRLTEPLTNPSTFDFVFNTIEGSRSGEGVALSLSGNDPVSDELVALTLAWPVSLRRGDEYALGSTFTIEVGLDWNDGDPAVTILDDGCGMAEAILVEAMRFGGAGPGTLRARGT